MSWLLPSPGRAKASKRRRLAAGAPTGLETHVSRVRTKYQQRCWCCTSIDTEGRKSARPLDKSSSLRGFKVTKLKKKNQLAEKKHKVWVSTQRPLIWSPFSCFPIHLVYWSIFTPLFCVFLLHFLPSFLSSRSRCSVISLEIHMNSVVPVAARLCWNDEEEKAGKETLTNNDLTWLLPASHLCKTPALVFPSPVFHCAI